MRMYDQISLEDKDAKVRFTKDGYLVATPRIARTGIQLYRGSECGIADKDIVRVFRPEDEVFNDAAVKSYTHRPVTLDHPPESVTAANWKKYAVGQTGDEPLRDGSSIRIPMVLMDAAAIKAYRDGMNQLSVGYDCDIEASPGKTKDGEEYDLIQRGIRANHLAVVAAARGGPSLTIGDDDHRSSKGDTIMNDTTVVNPNPPLRTVLIDSIEVRMPDTAAQVVQKTISDLEMKLRDAFKKVKELEEEGEEDDEAAEAKDAAIKAKDAALKAKDAEIQKRDDALKAKDAEVATLKQTMKDAEMTADKLDAMVRERIDVITKGRELVGDRLAIEGKSVTDMRRQVVDSKLGEMARGWDDNQIKASFDTIQVQARRPNGSGHQPTMLDDVRTSFGRPGAGYMTDTQIKDAAYADYAKDLENAWRGPQKAA